MSPTERQKEAIDSEAAITVIAAGPGSGKTSTLVARIMRFIATGTRPSEIAVLTFTNAAARELEERLAIARSESAADRPDVDPIGFIGTLHGFALRHLRRCASLTSGRPLSLVSPEASVDLLESAARTAGARASTKDLVALKRAGVKRGGRPTVDEVAVLSYFDALRESGLIDLDELLPELLRSLKDGPSVSREWSALFVDEAQDSAPIDWAIYRALPMASKTFVGDPDQSIYGFRGADVQSFLEMAAAEGVKLVSLEDNFRSGSAITEAAQRLIEHNPGRLPKVTRSATGKTGAVTVFPPVQNDGMELGRVTEAITVCFKNGTPINEIAILARTNAVAAEFAKGLEAAGVPVLRKGRYNVPRDWTLARAVIDLSGDPENDTLAFFLLVHLLTREGLTGAAARKAAHGARAEAQASRRPLIEQHVALSGANGPRSQHAAQAAQACMAFGISRESRMIVIEKIREVGENATLGDLQIALADIGEYVDRDTPGDGVRVLTIHGAKGREFDVVFLVAFEDEAIPGNRQDVNIEEERRLAYVAITRARHYLSISSAAFRSVQWGDGLRNPSRFLAEIEGRAP